MLNKLLNLSLWLKKLDQKLAANSVYNLIKFSQDMSESLPFNLVELEQIFFKSMQLHIKDHNNRYDGLISENKSRLQASPKSIKTLIGYMTDEEKEKLESAVASNPRSVIISLHKSLVNSIKKTINEILNQTGHIPAWKVSQELNSKYGVVLRDAGTVSRFIRELKMPLMNPETSLARNLTEADDKATMQLAVNNLMKNNPMISAEKIFEELRMDPRFGKFRVNVGAINKMMKSDRQMRASIIAKELITLMGQGYPLYRAIKQLNESKGYNISYGTGRNYVEKHKNTIAPIAQPEPEPQSSERNAKIFFAWAEQNRSRYSGKASGFWSWAVSEYLKIKAQS